MSFSYNSVPCSGCSALHEVNPNQKRQTHKSGFFPNFAWLFSVMKNNSSVLFYKRDQSKCKFLWLLSARIKIHQILLIFETANWFLFKFCTFLQFSSLLFSLIFYIISTKRTLSKHKFGEISSEQSKAWAFAPWWAPLVQII